MLAARIATVFGITSAIFHKNIVSSSPHKTESFISLYPGLPQVSTTSYVFPYTINCKNSQNIQKTDSRASYIYIFVGFSGTWLTSLLAKNLIFVAYNPLWQMLCYQKDRHILDQHRNGSPNI